MQPIVTFPQECLQVEQIRKQWPLLVPGEGLSVLLLVSITEQYATAVVYYKGDGKDTHGVPLVELIDL